MTVSELEFGALKSSHSTTRMRDSAIFLAQIPVVPFDASVARAHAELRFALRNAPIGSGDLIIAATAIKESRILVSSNLREFARVPGLSVESWRS